MFDKLSNEQRSILMGTILGDGNINKNGGITIAASQKHEDYLQWKLDRLKSLNPGPMTVYSRHDKRYNKIYTTVRFYLGKLAKEERYLFYPEGKKIIPPGVFLDELSISIWILDDGCLVNGSSYSIATNAFSSSDLLRACFILKLSGIKSHPLKDGRIAIGAEYSRKVGEWISRIVKDVPSMRHKVAFRGRPILRPKILIICEACGKTFMAYESENRRACSSGCGNKIKAYGYQTRKDKQPCIRCGEEFVIYNKRQAKCPGCRGLRVDAIPCPICGNPVWHEERTTCSSSCGVAFGHRSRPERLRDNQAGPIPVIAVRPSRDFHDGSTPLISAIWLLNSRWQTEHRRSFILSIHPRQWATLPYLSQRRFLCVGFRLS